MLLWRFPNNLNEPHEPFQISLEQLRQDPDLGDKVDAKLLFLFGHDREMDEAHPKVVSTVVTNNNPVEFAKTTFRQVGTIFFPRSNGRKVSVRCKLCFPRLVVVSCLLATL
jgi:hypothetical protein